MKGRLALALLATTLAVAAVPPAAAGAATACEQSLHLGVRWGWFPGFVGEDGPVYLYYASEPAGESGTSTEKLTILAVEKSCPTPPQPAQASYSVSTPVGVPRPASPGLDYDAVASSTGPLYDHRASPNEHRFDVTVRADALPEPVVEQARAEIVVTEAARDTPQQVPLYVVDSDGLSRVSLETSGPYPQREAFRYIVVPVFRAGADLSQPMEVPYTVTGSGSSPATPGADFTVTSPQPLVFGPNERAKAITMLLRADGVPEPQEQATVALTGPGVGLDPQDPTSATIELIDTAGGVAPPTSSLHHPNNGVRYKRADYRIREVHVFTKKGGGGAITQAELALRMNHKSGCLWFDGKRFVGRDCQNPLWFRADGQYEPDLFYYRMRALKPSKGKIRDYTMFSRATDLSRTTEDAFTPGRNQNTFEVRPAKKKKKGR